MNRSVKKQIQDQVDDSLVAWVLYRLPGENLATLMYGNLKTLKAEQWPEREGFVLAPFKFSESHPGIFLQATAVPIKINEYSFLLSGFKPDSNREIIAANILQVTKEEYLKNLEELILQLQAGLAGKVVISRTTTTQRIPVTMLPALYRELCLQYPAAFVYLANFHPYGTWMGATPEALISCTGNHCTTMSLAGSRPLGSHEKWGKKEQEEQRIVTRYIEEKILTHRVQNLRISEPFTKPAGQVEHLCTDFEFDLCDRKDFASMVKQLHPTPAVCGIPLLQAKQFIREYETHEREYYTGFLGPANYDDKTELFVNLRCMKLLKNNTLLFVGGGITRDSVPDKEWEETELKSRTLLSVIEKIRNLAL